MARRKDSRKGQPEKEFAVIGLGRFGSPLAQRLEDMGHVVLGVDADMARVQAIADDITSAVALDATVEDALAEVDIASFGTVIVAIDDDFEAATLVTAYLKGHDVRRVICLAKTWRHRDILLRIGADQVILPQEDSGRRLAETLAAPNLLERILLDPEHSVVELRPPASLVGKPVSSLGRYQVEVILIQRQTQLLPNPGPETRLEAGDAVFAVGLRDKLLEVAALP